MQIFSFLRCAVLGAFLCAAIGAQTADSLTKKEGTLQRSAEVKPGETPKGLSTAEWASIQHQIEQNRYRLERSQQGVAGANPSQGWTLNFDARGLSLDPADRTSKFDAPRSVRTAHESPRADLVPLLATKPSFRLEPVVRNAHATRDGLRLTTTAIGRADALTPVAGATPVVRDNKVELRHTQATEWYVNSSLGLEHGYTFERAPQGERGEVRIQLAVDGGFKAQPAADGVWLTDESGKQRMRYHKLLVVDANKQTLDARLSIAADDRLEIAFDDTHATYPVIVDPLLVNQEAKLVADDGAFPDHFGFSVAASGDIAVVGAPFDSIGTNADQGSVYVFVRSGNTWNQQAKLVADDGGQFDQFGFSVALSGDTAVVGARGDDVGTNFDQGSAYVFVRSGSIWTRQTKLVAGDGAAADAFGVSVAVSGDTVVIGADRADIGASSDQGSAYVFVRSGGTWNDQAKLLAAPGAMNDLFGVSVAVSGDTAVVGTVLHDSGASADNGSAYVFVRSGSTWNQQAMLLAGDGASFDFFGNSVAVSGDTTVVGALFDDIGANTDQGSAYVFVRSDSTWNQQAKLLAADGARRGHFGQSVAVSGETILVGSNGDDIGANINQGSAYVFTRSISIWNQQTQLLAGDGTTGDAFGVSVAVSGNTAVVGADFDAIGANISQGSAYVFRIADDDDAPAPTALKAFPVPAVTITQGLRVRIVLRPRATLLDATHNAPIAGRTVNFTVGPRNAPLCMAVTNANGVARCQANLANPLRALLRLGYTARFDGDAAYSPSSDKAGVLGLKLF